LLPDKCTEQSALLILLDIDLSPELGLPENMEADNSLEMPNVHVNST